MRIYVFFGGIIGFWFIFVIGFGGRIGGDIGFGGIIGIIGCDVWICIIGLILLIVI